MAVVSWSATVEYVKISSVGAVSPEPGRRRCNALELCARNGGAALQGIACQVVQRRHRGAAEDLLIKGCQRLPIAGNQVGVAVGCSKAHRVPGQLDRVWQDLTYVPGAPYTYAAYTVQQ